MTCPDLARLKLQDPDAFYARLASLHDGLDAMQSLELSNRIILLLANQVGDARILDTVLEAACKAV